MARSQGTLRFDPKIRFIYFLMSFVLISVVPLSIYTGFGCEFYYPPLPVHSPQSLLKSNPPISSVPVSCSILTIIATVPSILGCYHFPAEQVRKIYHIECFQTLFDSILFSLWLVTSVFMNSEHGDSDLPGLGSPPKLSWRFGTILVVFET